MALAILLPRHGPDDDEGGSFIARAMKLLMNASQINGLPVVTVRGRENVAEVRAT